MSPSEAFEADYFDGRTSARRRVTVSREGARVRIAGDGVALDLALHDLAFQPRVGSLPMRIGLPGQGLLVAQADAVATVLPVPRAAGAAHFLENHRGAMWGSIAGVAASLALIWFLGVPWAAERIARELPVEVESELAEEGLEGLDRLAMHPSDLRDVRQEALARQFDEMVRLSGTNATLHFRNGGWIGPNAFALPGGKIVLTDQLVRAMENDDQVMAVLAHEIGHVHHRHTTRHLLQTSVIALGSVLLLGDVSAVGSFAAAMPTVLLHTSYSRDFEREADAFSFDLLEKTGRSPRHFAQAMSLLEASVASRREARGEGGDADGGIPGFLSTHPVTKERIRAARDAAR
jgi:hypothetical protein